MGEPVIVLLGGVPGTGKTTLAGKLSRRLGINLVLGGDPLREFARGMVDPKDPDKAALFSSVYDCWKLVGERADADTVVRGFELQGRLLNDGLRRMLERCLADGESVIVEYIHLLPDQLGDLLRRPEVHAWLLVADEAAVHEQRLHRRSTDTHPRSRPQRLVDHLREYRWMQDRLIAAARSAGIPVEVVDRADPEELAEKVAAALGRAWGARGPHAQ